MNIVDIIHVKKQVGEVGIEIEVEGTNLPDAIQLWRTEHDGSLRNGMEYVLRSPVERERVPKALLNVERAYKKAGTEVTDSNRQSVHVHINVQELTLTQIYNFICLFLIFEQPLVEYCGAERKNNLFCLRSVDAGGLITSLEECANPDNFRQLDTNNLRYASINVSSLFKYGSLEFRSMRGTAEFGLIQNWVDILLSLKDSAKTYDTPVDIINNISIMTPEDFTIATLGEYAGIVFANDDWENLIFDSMREIQMLAHTGDWEGLSAAKEKPEMEEVILDEMVDDGMDFAAPPPAAPEPARAEAPRFNHDAGVFIRGAGL